MHSLPARNVMVIIGMGLLAALHAGGCATKGGARDIPQSQAVGGGQRRSVTTTPLSVRVADASQLATVSSILIVPPSLSDSMQRSLSLPSATIDSLEAIAERELTVTVFGRRWVEGAPERERLVRELSHTQSLEPLRRQGVDALLRTEVTSFVERRGSAVGGEPASVAFVMTLVRVADSRELWQGTFSYGQTFLSDNLLQLGDLVGERRRGPGWSSGREIFEAGVSSALRDLNTRREQEFLVLK
jgi:hypothetical protein